MAELHVHLFGAISRRVLLELARRHRVALPAGLDDGANSEILANPPHEAGFAGTPDGFRFGFETDAAV